MTPNLSRAVWRKSSRSAGNGGNCVEVTSFDGGMAVRDSKRPNDGTLLLSAGEWRTFISATKRGEFDR